MALILADRVKQESTTTGTGNIVFSGGVDGFQAFSAVCSTNDTLYYVIEDKIGTDFEIGHGTFNSSGQLERTNILQSSNSDNAVNFGAGTKNVFITYPADKAVFQNFDGSITIPSTIDGRDLATDGTKLDGIESSATADQTASEIRSLVESASDSNVFTDADHTKLNGIEASATADQTNDEIKAAVEAASDSNTFTDADHTKLNSIEASATADQTKSEIEALNINADTLDGQHGSYYTGYADTAVSNLVDSSPTALNTLNELAAALGDDANFSTTVNNNIATKLPKTGGTMTGQISLGDNVKTNFGASNDLQIYHDGSNSKIETDSGSVGDLYIASQRSGSDLYLRAENDIKIQPQGGENGIVVQGDGGVVIYNDNGFKFETDGQGANISGVLDVSSKMNVAGGTDATSSDGAIRTAGGVSAAKKMYVGTDLTVANNIAVTGTVDGRDIATDGTKLDTVETNADVTDTTNVTSAGALMTTGGTITGNVAHGDNVQATFGDDGDFQIYHSGSSSIVRESSTGNLLLAGNDVNITNGAMNATHIDCNNGGSVELYHNNNFKFSTLSDGARVVGNLTISGTVDGVDIATRDGVLTSTTTTANAALPKTGGTMTGDLDVQATITSDQLIMGDNQKVRLGNAGDLEIYHNGTDNYIYSNNKTLRVQGNGSPIKLSPVNADLSAEFKPNGAVDLYHNAVKKFETSATGATLTGNLALTGTVDGRDVATDGSKLDGIESSANVTDTANVTSAGALMDSEIASLASVKAINQGLSSTSSPTFADLTISSAYPDFTIIDSDAGYTAKMLFQQVGGGSILKTFSHSNDGEFIIMGGASSTEHFKVNSSGHITVSGTVDGRDLASDGSKLDGIASGANNITNNNQLTNGAGYITSFTNTTYSAGTGMSLSGTTFNCTIDSPSEVGLGNLSSSGNSLSGSFTASGNITAYSSRKLKSDIKTIDNALDKVSQMRGVTFTKDGELSSGVIAEEFEEVAPELVQDGEYKSVAYGNTVGYLIEAIKELKAEVEELKSKKNCECE